MARERTDLNDASSLGSGYERDDIDRLFYPDREPPLAPFGSLDENLFGGAYESGSHSPWAASGAGLLYAVAVPTAYHTADGLAMPHDVGSDMPGPAGALFPRSCPHSAPPKRRQSRRRSHWHAENRSSNATRASPPAS